MSSDINECQNAAANECDPIRAECFDESPTKENGNAKYRCKCLAGFTGDGTKNTCVDIVECTETPDICGTTGEKICENLVPGYKVSKGDAMRNSMIHFSATATRASLRIRKIGASVTISTSARSPWPTAMPTPVASIP